MSGLDNASKADLLERLYNSVWSTVQRNNTVVWDLGHLTHMILTGGVHLTNRKRMLFRELRKDAALFRDVLPFLGNDDQDCVVCRHGYWQHLLRDDNGNTMVPNIPVACYGTTVSQWEKGQCVSTEQVPCEKQCPGFKRKPLV